jgi:hypothetical protein
VTVVRSSGDVRVEVTTVVRWLGRGRVSVDVSGSAMAALEPTVLPVSTVLPASTVDP